MAMALAGFMTIYFKRQNKVKERILAEHGRIFTAEEKEEREDDGEMVPWFKFTA